MTLQRVIKPLFKKAAFVFLFLCLTKPLFINLCFARDIYSFLNPGLDYEIMNKDDNIFRLQPEGTQLVTVNFTDGKIQKSMRYYVKGEADSAKLQLVEYDFLSRIYLREDLVALSILDKFTKKDIFKFHKDLYRHFHAFKELKYPQQISGVHGIYSQILETAGSYLNFETGDDELIFDNTTIVYRIMGIYNAHTNRRRLLKGTLLLDEILKAAGIQPY